MSLQATLCRRDVHLNACLSGSLVLCHGKFMRKDLTVKSFLEFLNSSKLFLFDFLVFRHEQEGIDFWKFVVNPVFLYLRAEHHFITEGTVVCLPGVGLHFDESETLLALKNANFQFFCGLLLLMSLYKFLNLLVVFHKMKIFCPCAHHLLSHNFRLVCI